MIEIEMKVCVVDGIKEVKKFFFMLLVWLKKINKKLVELRSQFFKLKDSGRDKVMKVENEEMFVLFEVLQDEKQQIGFGVGMYIICGIQFFCILQQ